MDSPSNSPAFWAVLCAGLSLFFVEIVIVYDYGKQFLRSSLSNTYSVHTPYLTKE